MNIPYNNDKDGGEEAFAVVPFPDHCNAVEQEAGDCFGGADLFKPFDDSLVWILRKECIDKVHWDV